MCIWKAWKLPKTRVKNLIKCVISAYNARRWGYCKGYWRESKSPIMTLAASTANLKMAGYPHIPSFAAVCTINSIKVVKYQQISAK